MHLRPDHLRTLAVLLATVAGFFAGLIGGAMAEAVIFPLALLATGHSHPLDVLDGSFSSHPVGLLALTIITGYLTTAFFAAMAAWTIARKLLAHWNPPAPKSVAAIVSQIRNIWRKAGRG